MRTFHSIYITSVIVMIALANCTNQRYASGETDDIYFSASDRASDNLAEHNTIKEVNGEDYKESSAPSTGYYSIGKETSPDNQNQNSEQAYANGMSSSAPDNSAQSAATVNNFYGNTTYTEGDYVDDSYATRLRRFNNTNVSIGYYDPFFVDPYWNWGWNAWNRPVGGWSVGWNSWGGWNVGYNVGWGYPAWGYNNYCAWNRWNDPYFYNSPWNGCYGANNWGPNYGWGYGSRWNNGYAWGYRDGFNDGFYGSGRSLNRTPTRPVVRGRAPVAGNDGFSSQVVDRNASDSRNHTQVDRLNNGKVVDRTNATSKNQSQLATVERLDRSNNIYQTNRNSANPRAEAAASQYDKNARSNASEKYSVQPRNRPNANANPQSSGQKQVVNNRERANAQYSNKSTSGYSGSSRATYGKSRTNSSQVNRPNSTNRSEVRSEKIINPRNQATGGDRTRTNTNSSAPRQYTPSNTQKRSNYQPRTNSQPQRNGAARPSQNTRSRATTPRTSPSRTAPSRTRSNSSMRSAPSRTAPSRSPSRSYSAPRSAPSRSMSSPSPSRGRSGASSPSRSGGRR